MIEQAIVARLKANATITALVANRIYPNHAPQSQGVPTYPYLVYARESATHGIAVSGPSGIASANITVAVYAQGPTEYADAKTLTDTIRGPATSGGLHGYAGTVAGFKVLGIFLQSDKDEYLSPQHADEFGVQGVPSEFLVWWNE